MKIVSVNVGRPRIVLWKGTQVSTGIFKSPVEGPVEVGDVNLRGDRQADLSAHGGRFKSAYGYPSEHYAYWRQQLPQSDLPWGAFGENLTTEGLLETDLDIGDHLRIGSALLQVTQPRSPCYKLTIRFNRDDMVKRFAESNTSGFYFAVLEQGTLQAGDEITIVERDPAAVSVVDINRLYYRESQDPELLARAVALDALPENWRDYLRRRGV